MNYDKTGVNYWNLTKTTSSLPTPKEKIQLPLNISPWHLVIKINKLKNNLINERRKTPQKIPVFSPKDSREKKLPQTKLFNLKKVNLLQPVNQVLTKEL